MSGVARHKQSHCPACGKPIDAAGTIDGHDTYVPVAGDVSVCFGCAGVLIYDADLSVRLPTTDELVAFPPEQQAEVADLQQKIKLLNEILPKGGTEPPAV